jgi:hypothetical protein
MVAVRLGAVPVMDNDMVAEVSDLLSGTVAVDEEKSFSVNGVVSDPIVRVAVFWPILDMINVPLVRE